MVDVSEARRSLVTRVLQIFTFCNVFENIIRHIILLIYATNKLPNNIVSARVLLTKDGP